MPEDADDILDKFKDVDHSKELENFEKGVKKKTKNQIRAENYRKRSDEINRGENLIWTLVVISIVGITLWLIL